MSTKSFSGIKRADIDRIRGELGKIGVEMPVGDNVEVKGPFGVKMKVDYDEPSSTLQLSITDKPAFISHDQIWKVVQIGATTGKYTS